MGETTSEIKVDGQNRDLPNVDPDLAPDLGNGDVYATALEDNSSANEAETPEEIEARITQTRSELSDTINALQEKLNPERLKEQVTEQVKEQVHDHIQSAKDTVREATIGKAEQIMHNASDTIGNVARPVVEAVGRAADSALESAQSASSTVAETAKDTGAAVKNHTTSVLDTLRENPLATALAAVGIGMLILKSNQTSGTTTSTSYQNRYNGSSASSPVAKAQSAVSGAVGGVQDTLGHVADKASDMAGQTHEAASHLKHQAQEQVGQLTDQTREKVHDLGQNAQYQKHLAQDRLQETLQENPLAVGVVALAVGAAVGLLVPSTEPEKNLLGETGGKIMDTAHTVAHETVQKVQHVAGRVVEEAGAAATAAAKDEGLTL